MVAKELRDQNGLLEDPEVSEYINNIGQRLAAQSAMGGQNFHYFVVKDTSINALFAQRFWQAADDITQTANFGGRCNFRGGKEDL